jgi:hypothetical protein
MADQHEDDPDLPGDERFTPLPPVVDVVVDTPGGPAIAMGMTISAQAQADLHHNRLRYGELRKARLGLANEYARTRYRHGG